MRTADPLNKLERGLLNLAHADSDNDHVAGREAMFAVVEAWAHRSAEAQPGAEAIGGARLFAVPSITAGSVLVAQADQIVAGLRQDASVTFSPTPGSRPKARLRVSCAASRGRGTTRRARTTGRDMPDPRWKAAANIVVAGRPVKAGDTFNAPAETVAQAVARRLVTPAPAPDNGRRKRAKP